jgi:phosphoribosylformylglycinamidine cyclo-ligase
MGSTYKEAGVDIDRGDALVERIKPLAKKTTRKEVISGVGGFGGLFALDRNKYREPVLVSGTDGVGTKLKVAFEMNRHHSIGIDLVAMSVNDILTCGAEPLFFLDYLATSRLDIDQAEQVISGIAEGCALSRCTLLGGETAELPGFYQPQEYDLAGFCVGVVERTAIIDGRDIRPRDKLLGLPSSGLHSNGFSLARLALQKAGRSFSDTHPLLPNGITLGDALLEPTRIYVDDILALTAALPIKGMAHITGSGLPGNVPRCFPEHTRAVIDSTAWRRAPIFDVIQNLGSIDSHEMYNTFNCGVGFVVVVADENVSEALRLLKARGVDAQVIGAVEAQPGEAEPQAVLV